MSSPVSLPGQVEWDYRGDHTPLEGWLEPEEQTAQAGLHVSEAAGLLTSLKEGLQSIGTAVHVWVTHQRWHEQDWDQ